MSHIFQVGDMVKVKATHLERGGLDLRADFDIRSHDDPDNFFEITEIYKGLCGDNHAECKRLHGCLGPIRVKRVTNGFMFPPMCLGFGSGHAFELGDPPELIERFKELGIEASSCNHRRKRNR